MDFINLLLNDPVVLSLSKTLLHFCWQGALIAGILYLFLNSVDKKHAEIRYLGAISSMLLFVLVPVLTFVSMYSEYVSSPEAVQVTQLYLQDALVSLEQVEAQTFLPFAALFWVAGVFYMSTQLCVEMFRVYQLPKKQVMPVEAHVQQLFDSIAQRLEVNKIVKVMASTKAEVPMVIGWMKPVVLVPVSMLSGLSTAQLEMLFAHELGHVKRHDFLINLLQTFVEILFFFHPAVKWVSKQVRVEREYCCDDIAISCCGNAHSYARTLAEAESIRKSAIPDLIMAATGGDLKGRVLRMVQQSDCSDNFSHSWHTVALAAVFAVSLASFTFYAQDGLQARFADTLGHQPEDEFEPEAEPTVKVEVAMNNQQTEALPVNRSEAPVAPVVQLPQKEEVIALVAEAEIVDQSDIVSDAVLSNEDIVLASLSLDELQSQSDATTVALATVENQIEVVEPQPAVFIQSQIQDVASNNADVTAEDVFGDLEGFNQSSVALKASLAKLNEKIQSEGFALSIESDKIAMAVEPKTIDAPTIIAPRLLRSSPPKYPRAAVSRGVEAEVVVSFTVNDRGRVENLHFENKVQGYFKRSIRKALNNWRYEPGTIDGELANMSMQKVFTFSDPNNFAENAGEVVHTGSRIAKDI